MNNKKNWLEIGLAALAIVALAALVVSVDFGSKANAQPRPGYGLLSPQVVLYSGTGGNSTNSLNAGTVYTFNPPIKIDLSQGVHKALQFRGQGATAALASSNTFGIALGIGRNIDGYNPGGTTNSDGLMIWGLTPNGTTQFTVITNLLPTATPWMGSVPYAYIYWASNNCNAGNLTNYSVVAVAQ